MLNSLIVRQLNLQPYEATLCAMRAFTATRSFSSRDEVWLVQHPEVFTQGKLSKSEDIIKPSNIPLIQSDRGGQITFHGPGQQIMYFLLNVRRRQLSVHNLITLLEKIVIATLSDFDITSYSNKNARGVYVGNEKICSLGLRIQRGFCFHGFALNVDMDLSPFSYINPCGQVGLRMTQVCDLSPGTGINDVTPVLLMRCLQFLKIKNCTIESGDLSCYSH